MKNAKLMQERDMTLQKLKNFENWQKQWFNMLNMMIFIEKISSIRSASKSCNNIEHVLWEEISKWTTAVLVIQKWFKKRYSTANKKSLSPEDVYQFRYVDA